MASQRMPIEHREPSCLARQHPCQTGSWPKCRYRMGARCTRLFMSMGLCPTFKAGYCTMRASRESDLNFISSLFFCGVLQLDSLEVLLSQNIDRVPLSKVITCSFFQPKDQSKLPGQAEIHLEKHSSGPEVAIASLLHSVVVAHEGFVGGPSCETAEKAVAHVMSVDFQHKSTAKQ